MPIRNSDRSEEHLVIVTADEMREMDRRTIEAFGVPGRVLMENAGLGATRILLKRFPDLPRQRVGVLAGRGNNGGDGFVIARHLSQKGIRVVVYLLSGPASIRGDAEANFKLLSPLGIPVREMPEQAYFRAQQTAMRHQDIWIDAILGAGLKSDVKGYYREVIEFINGLERPVVAVDIPSGLNSNTGQPCGVCIRAAMTVTFGFAKVGQLIHPGVEYTGDLGIVDIGIPPSIARGVDPRHRLLTPGGVAACFAPRPPDSHKGHTGRLLVAAGSPGKTGAAAMAAMSAMRVGAGLVTLATPESLNPILETRVLEAMTHPLPETVDGMLGESALDAVRKLLPGKQCLALGPGIGVSEQTDLFVHRLIRESTVPLVIDADGLNSIALDPGVLKNLSIPVVLTPLPGEMARLAGASVAGVQKDRIGCARDFANAFQVHVVLKGARTVIAHPDGRVYINPTGNPGMASGGMGDVLTGMIAGLIVQGLSPEAAAHAGVYLHGAAADALARTRGPFGFVASDVMEIIPRQIGELLAGKPAPLGFCRWINQGAVQPGAFSRKTPEPSPMTEMTR